MDWLQRDRSLVQGILVLAAITLTAKALSAATIIVPDDNPSLTDAVAGAAAGDTIQVRPGNYVDRVDVVAGQDGLTIVGLGGRPVFTAANRKEGFRVSGVSGITITGFAFENRLSAVRLEGCTACIVQDIVATDCREGVRAKFGANVYVLVSTFTNVTRGRAIRIQRAPGSAAFGNTITGTKREGIIFDRVDPLVMDSVALDPIIAGNTVTDAKTGIVVKTSADGFVYQNTTSSCRSDGIAVGTAPGLYFADNHAVGNGSDGFQIDRAAGITIENNDATDNASYGFRVSRSPPITSPADLTTAGNTAGGNGSGDFRVTP